jgi:hypothetical protein
MRASTRCSWRRGQDTGRRAPETGPSGIARRRRYPIGVRTRPIHTGSRPRASGPVKRRQQPKSLARLVPIRPSAENTVGATLGIEVYCAFPPGHQARSLGRDASLGPPNRSGPAAHRVRHDVVPTRDIRRRVRARQPRLPAHEQSAGLYLSCSRANVCDAGWIHTLHARRRLHARWTMGRARGMEI